MLPCVVVTDRDLLLRGRLRVSELDQACSLFNWIQDTRVEATFEQDDVTNILVD